MKVCAIIPARYHSKRLPGKPLHKINKMEILLLTYNKVKKNINEKDIYIFTDSKIVIDRLKDKIKNILFIKGNFKNGTERASYGVKKIKEKYSAALLVSCDNPFIGKEAITKTLKAYKIIENNKDYCGSTVHLKNKDISIMRNKNIAKAIISKNNDIMYLSRSQVPSKVLNNNFFYTHHGPVCLKINHLKRYLQMKSTPLQIAEDNEWLKYIESGYKIKSNLINKMATEINTIQDLKFYREKYKNK